MTLRIVPLLLLLLSWAAPLFADFDERLWEHYAELSAPGARTSDGLGCLYLEPSLLGRMAASPPFADLRVMDDRRRETPWQLIVHSPAIRREELPLNLFNRSTEQDGSSWVEGRFENGTQQFSALDIDVAGTEFYRQVQVLGSTDGVKWNTLRKDGVIFDRTRGDRLRHTRVSIPSASYRHVAVRIVNAGQPPLELRGMTAIRERERIAAGQSVPGQLGAREELDAGRTVQTLRFPSRWPVNRLELSTPDRNFQRQVTVQAKRGDSWQEVARGHIFSYETPTVRESSLKIDLPDSAEEELRLLFHNHDSPALNISQVSGTSYRRQLVFRTEPGRSYYLFWGNPRARMPRYDLSGLVARENQEAIPVFAAGQRRDNSGFAGDNARLPLTERYRWLLYSAMALVVAGLLALQFRVLKKGA